MTKCTKLESHTTHNRYSQRGRINQLHDLQIDYNLTYLITNNDRYEFHSGRLKS